MRPPGDERAETHAIVVDGHLVYTLATVRTWHETGLLFDKLRPRKETGLITLHWTASENPPVQVHRNMQAEGLSVHFVIDQFGIIWQMCDADRLCAHAEGVNVRAVGIEMINRGTARDVPTRGVERPVRKERIFNQPVTYTGFTIEQQVACISLVRTLCTAYQLPMRVPLEGNRVRATRMTKAELMAYRGVIGHLHAMPPDRHKVDPGLAILEHVQLHGLAA